MLMVACVNQKKGRNFCLWALWFWQFIRHVSRSQLCYSVSHKCVLWSQSEPCSSSNMPLNFRAQKYFLLQYNKILFFLKLFCQESSALHGDSFFCWTQIITLNSFCRHFVAYFWQMCSFVFFISTLSEKQKDTGMSSDWVIIWRV